ncbi:MAG: discoidin domain-containing protein [bacterium]
MRISCIELQILNMLGKYKLSFFVFLMLVFLSRNSIALLELSLVRPFDNFTTNNKELVIEGFVKFLKGQQIIVSINTSAGFPDLSSLEDPIQSLTLDLGSVQQLKSLLIFPVITAGFSFGPRVINVFSSADGQNYIDKGRFNCISGIEQEYGEVRIDFKNMFDARFIRVDMIDGWQSSIINIKDISLIDKSEKRIRTKIKSVSFVLRADDLGYSDFMIVMILREGENQISILAQGINPDIGTGRKEEDFKLIRVNYLPEVKITEDPIILSDGYKAELTIPPGALDSNIKKISITPLNVTDIEWGSYIRNPQIAKDTLPLVGYKFDVAIESPFPVTAKDYLERQPPSLVVDGNPQYPSTWITSLSPLPVWLKIDLRSPQTIGKLIIIARLRGKTSYGPNKVTILTSDDDLNYVEVAKKDDCNDEKTEITLPSMPTARYIQMVIEEGKQGNNIQINEIELRDIDGTKITSYAQLKSITLKKTARLTMFYETKDLISSKIKTEKNLSIFAWNENTNNWQFVGGKLNTDKGYITVNLNYLTTFAIFESVSSGMDISWSYNPFSPNGDGIADTTTLRINSGERINILAKVEIFDCTGKLVRTLIHEEIDSGQISIMWDGKNENGERVKIGPYIYQVTVGEKVHNGVLVVVK